MTKASGEDNPKKKGFPSLETLMQHTATNRSYLSTFQAEEVELIKMKAKARTAMPINKQSPSLKKKNSRPSPTPFMHDRLQSHDNKKKQRRTTINKTLAP